MTRPRLVTAGEAMIRLSPPPDQRLRTTPSLRVHVGGSELNAAIAASQLGVDACWVTALPDGPLAERIVDHARSFGVEVVKAASSDRVGLYFVEIGAAPRNSEVHYDREGSSFSTTAADDLAAEALTGGADAVLASGITLALGEAPTMLVHRLLDVASRATRFFEVNHRRKLWADSDARTAIEKALHSIDVLIASPYDLTGLLELGDDAEAAARHAREQWSLDAVVLTARDGSVGERGRNEITVVVDGPIAHARSEGMVVDPVGAGDASTGAYIATWLRTGSHQSAADSAVHAAAMKQTVSGDAAVLDTSESTDGGPRIRR